MPHSTTSSRSLLLLLLTTGLTIQGYPTTGHYSTIGNNGQRIPVYPFHQPIVRRTAIGYAPPLLDTQVLTEQQRPTSSGDPEPVFVVGESPKDNLPVRTFYPDLAEVMRYLRDGKSNIPNLESENELKPSKSQEAQAVIEEIIAEQYNSRSQLPQNQQKVMREQEQMRPVAPGDNVAANYANYYSLYYDPYFYTRNGYDSHLMIPNVYHLGVQPQPSVDPLPPSQPDFAPVRLLPVLHELYQGREEKPRVTAEGNSGEVGKLPIELQALPTAATIVA